MYKNHTYLQDYIDKILNADNLKKSLDHTPSGKLTASILGYPTQWQVLKTIGIPQDNVDPYTLRKFARGEDVENWICSIIPAVETQKNVEYKNVVGRVDAIVDTSRFGVNHGIIPHEIKSVTNAKFKRIEKSGADIQHIYQACLYAMALNTQEFSIVYIASDDYRVLTYILSTSKYFREVEKIIADFNVAVIQKNVPEFKSKLSWHNNDKYNPYRKYRDMSSDEIKISIKNEYPDIFTKFYL